MKYTGRTRYTSGGRSRGGQKPMRRRHTMVGRVFLAVITFFNLLLSLLLAYQRRRDVLTVVQQPDGAMHLLSVDKTTKTPEK